ncbi:MAG: hypothetical protein ACI32N_04655 [Bulleidia sp.]
MSRETELRQLKEIRQAILAVHEAFDEAGYYHQNIQKLKKEKEKPELPKVKVKPVNTADRLQEQFLQKNAENARWNAPGIRNVKIANIVILTVILVCMAADGFRHLGILIKAGESKDVLTLLIPHAIITAVLAALPFCYEEVFEMFIDTFGFILKLITLNIILTVGLIEYFGLKQTGGWMYLIMTAVCFVGALIAIAVVNRSNENRAVRPKLTKEQKQQVEQARKNDELAKEHNAEIKAEAKAEWQKKRAKRLPVLEKELKENAEQFSRCTDNVNACMAKLNALDGLGDDDKNLQEVDILIRFIETHRADSIKEALQEYDRLIANQKLLAVEKQKVKAEMRRISQEKAAQAKMLEEQKKHQSEMEYWARDNARTRQKQLTELENLSHMIYHSVYNR